MDAALTVTMRDVARMVGLSQSGVSRALRDDTRIPEKTRKRVKAAAKRMGYRPDPALSALMVYRSERRQQKTHSEHGKIAVWSFPERGFPIMPVVQRQLVGIRERADELGYTTEVFSTGTTPAEQKQLSRVLRAQGVRGILVTSLPIGNYNLEHFGWEHFSAVSLSHGLEFPPLNFVAQDHERRIQLIYTKLRELGYRRIGFCGRLSVEFKNRHLQLGAYLKRLFLDGISADSLPPLLYDEYRTLEPEPWLRRHGFDAVIAGIPEEFHDKLKEINSPYQHPEKLTVAGAALAADVQPQVDFMGGTENLALQGSSAVDFLHQLLCHSQRGIPKHRQSILLEGEWASGRVLAPQGSLS